MRSLGTKISYRSLQWFIVVVLLPYIISSCTTGLSLAGRNIKDFYKQAAQDIDFEANVRHLNDQESIVYIRFGQAALVQNTSDDESTLNYSLRYKVYSNYSNNLPTDSANLVRKLFVTSTPRILVDSFLIPSQKGLNGVVELVVRDFNADRSQRLFVDVVRSKPFGFQDMKIVDGDGWAIFNPYLADLDSYDIHLTKPVEALTVRFYDRSFPTASPPFSTINPKAFDFTPDQIIEPKKLSDFHYRLRVDKQGFYQITDDPSQKHGATLFYFDQFYPDPKTVLSLIEPLRYISTNEEYDQLTSTVEMKKEVDAYWLNIGNNPERARELIRAYYGRVRWANEHFASYLEGWKSDRGMCYIVYGPPDAVFRSTATETWLYGEAGNFNALSLTFTKVVNPFTYNDFRLNRSTSLRNPWYRAVEFWRQGRVITYR